MYTIVSLLLSPFAAFAIANTQANSQANPEVEARSYDYNGVEKVEIVNTSGRINVLPMDLNKIDVVTRKRRFSERCSLTIAKTQAILVSVKVEAPNGESCEVDIDVKVPREISLQLVSGSGNVTIDGVGGTLDFNVGSGNVKANGEYKKVEGKVGSGNLDIKGLAGNVDVKIGSGTSQLGFLERAKGTVAVRSGSGNATLLFPKGTKLKTALSTGSGSLRNDFSQPYQADLNVSATTGSGNLSVEAY